MLAALAAIPCMVLAADPAELAGFGFQVEAYCHDGKDVFAGDGEGWLFHYRQSGNMLLPIRTLTTNPDVESCVVGPSRVYFIDPEFGVLAYNRSAETDLIMQPVYVQPPSGSGAFVPVSIEPVLSAERWQLRVLGAAGEQEIITPAIARSAALPSVQPALETGTTDFRGDAVDDAVVIAGESGEEAWILGTDKQGGLRIYDLDGRQHQYLDVGRLNNVDAVPVSAERFLVAASNRTVQSIDLFDVRLAPFRAERVMQVPLDFEDTYGLCMAQMDGEPHVFVGDKLGRVEQWRIAADYSAEKLQAFMFDSQTEGCVIDREDRTLFVGEEAAGIWAITLESGERRLVAAVGDGDLVADVEGLDIYYGTEGRKLVASSQGDDSFVIYDLPGVKPVLKFSIGEAPERGLDGVSETDGVAIHSEPLPGFPSGIMVVQDGRNVLPAGNQNFKVVDWREVERLLQAER